MARTLRLTSPPMKGEDVRMLQQTINSQLRDWKVAHRVVVDGEYGSLTRDALESVMHGLGIERDAIDHGVTPRFRVRLRRKWLTPAERLRYRDRAEWRDQLRRRYEGRGAAAAIAFAKRQIGTHESPSGSNWGPKVSDWIRAAGYDGPVPWCGCFVNACLMAAGVANGKGWIGYCPAIVGRARSGTAGWSWHTEGKVGDLALFDSGPGGDVAVHVGIVEQSLGGGRYLTIEGNTSSGDGGSQSNGGMVARRTRSVDGGFHIIGFARPPF